MWWKSPPSPRLRSALTHTTRMHSTTPHATRDGMQSTFQRRLTVTRRRERELASLHGPAWRYLQPTPPQVWRNTPVPNAKSSTCAAADGPTTSRGAHHPLEAVGSLPALLLRAKSTQADPLAEFLSKHQEEGPAFVAMWTSLHRSCVHRSELSESLVASIRNCFHRLIRGRALQAAIHLYFRLVEYGVSLKRSDVVMLLSNLPYERSVHTSSDTESAELFRVASKGSAALRFRKAKGSSEDPGEGMRGDSANDYTADNGINSNPSQSAAARTDACGQPLSSEGNVQALNGGSFVRPESRPGSLAPSVSQTRSARWLRRWAAYEAAMGNVEPTDAGDAGIDEWRRDHRLEFVSDDMQTDALVQHLCLLHKATVGSRLATVPRRRGVRRGLAASSYWAEALHVVAAHAQRSSTFAHDHSNGHDLPSSPTGSRFHLSPTVARSALAAVRLAPASVAWMHALRLLSATAPGTRSHHTVASFACSRFLTARLRSPWSALWIQRASTVIQASLIPALTERVVGESTSTAAMTSIGRAALALFDLRSGSTSDPLEVVLDRAVEFCALASRSLFLYGFDVKTRREQGVLREENREGAQRCYDEADESPATKHVVPVDLVDSVAALSRVTTEIIPYMAPAEVNELLLGTTGIATMWAMFYFADSHQMHRELKAVLNSPERSSVSTWTVRVCLAAVLSLSHRLEGSAVETCASILKVAVPMMQHVSSRDRDQLLVPLVHRAIAACLVRVMPLPAVVRHRNVDFTSALSSISSLAVLVECTRMILLLSPTVAALKQTQWEARRRFFLQLCSSNRSLRKEIVKQLTSTEAKRLHLLLESVERVGRRRTSRAPSAKSSAASVQDTSVTRIRRAAPLSAEDMDRIHVRRNIAAAVYHNVASVGSDPLRLAPCVASDIAAARGWYEALLVLDSYLRNTKPNTIPVDLFRAAMQTLVRSVQQSHMVSRRDHISRNHSTHAAASSPRDFWYDAARIFWSAVDHHALSTSGNLHQNTHLVLDKLVDTLLGVAMENQQPRVARQWFVLWQRSHAEHSTAAQLGSDEYLTQKLRLSVLVRERDALQQILFFWDKIAAPDSSRSIRESLLGAATAMCSRGEWHAALRQLQQSGKDNSADPSCLLAVLICLDGCPTPLSRSALLWFHRHKPHETWGAEHSAVLLRILTRARKWQEALACFSEPRLISVHSSCAAVLLMALRACAVGGRGEEAGRLFDCYTACAAGSAPQQPQSHPGTLHSEDTSSDVSLAKSFFYRAVTKAKLDRASTPAEKSSEGPIKI